MELVLTFARYVQGDASEDEDIVRGMYAAHDRARIISECHRHYPQLQDGVPDEELTRPTPAEREIQRHR